MTILGIDIGGTGIKGALVDEKKGELITDRKRFKTPSSLQPLDVLPVVKKLVTHFGYHGPIGIGFPAVVVRGVPRTPFTAHHVMEWVGFPVEAELEALTGCPSTLLNDADAAGLAEMRFGAGQNHPGTVLLLTLGTGIGSALFVDGRMVPNTEFGAIYLQGHDQYVEQYAAERVRSEQKLSWKQYAARLDEYLIYLNHLLRPDRIVLGGGVSKKSERFVPQLTVETDVVPAALRNEAGIIGAAVAAAGAIRA
jgi:polyphosphate glucokinase